MSIPSILVSAARDVDVVAEGTVCTRHARRRSSPRRPPGRSSARAPSSPGSCATETTLTFENNSLSTACRSTSDPREPGRLELGVGEPHHDPEARRLQRCTDPGRGDGAHHDQHLGPVVHGDGVDRARAERAASSAGSCSAIRSAPIGWIESARYCTGPANNRSRNESRSAGRGQVVVGGHQAGRADAGADTVGDRLPDRLPGPARTASPRSSGRPPSPPAPPPAPASPTRRPATARRSTRRRGRSACSPAGRRAATTICGEPRSCRRARRRRTATPVSTSASNLNASGPSTGQDRIERLNTPVLPELASAEAASSTMLPPVPSGSIASTTDGREPAVVVDRSDQCRRRVGQPLHRQVVALPLGALPGLASRRACRPRPASARPPRSAPATVAAERHPRPPPAPRADRTHAATPIPYRPRSRITSSTGSVTR